MDRFLRVLELNKIFNARRTPVSRRALEVLLESNRSTIKRTIEEMRLYLDAPIKYDHKQNGKILKKRRYELKIPYGNPAELVREILKYGAEVEVVSPKSLRDTVSSTLQASLKVYQK